MARARHIVIEGIGGPEVMTLVTEDIAPPAPGEVQIRQTAIGLNLIDTYQRRGVDPLELPSRLGFEAAGTVEALGFDVAGVSIGDRVAYMNAEIGAYADRRNVAAEKLVVLPEGVSDEVAASTFFKGMTEQYLLRKTHAVQAGDLLLVHTAAGGVGRYSPAGRPHLAPPWSERPVLPTSATWRSAPAAWPLSTPQTRTGPRPSSKPLVAARRASSTMRSEKRHCSSPALCIKRTKRFRDVGASDE